MKPHQRSHLALAAIAALSLHVFDAQAQIVINEPLTGKTSQYNWLALGGACLTAGDAPAGNGSGGTQNTIPGCQGNPYYTLRNSKPVGGLNGTIPDADTSGALRLSNGDTVQDGTNGNQQTGAVVSTFSFPTDQGIQLTWRTYTYGGNNFSGRGADGTSFFLADAAFPPTVGANGGSLGYSCTNINSIQPDPNNKDLVVGFDGVQGGYVGVGIDEYGNFSNPNDNTNSGDPGLHFRRISVRGAGNVSYPTLSAKYPDLYPANVKDAVKADAVHATCKDGTLHNFSGAAVVHKGVTVADRASTGEAIPDYKLLVSSDLPAGVVLANQEAVGPNVLPTRAKAVPIQYSLNISPAGLMDFSYQTLDPTNNGFGNPVPVFTNQDIVKTNGALPAAFRFGFSSGTGGGSNVHEIACFKAVPADQSNSTAGSNVQSGRSDDNTQIYLASYHTKNWWGELSAHKLNFDEATNTLSIATAKTWDAGCVLTGSCAGGPAKGIDPASRTVLSAIVGTGVGQAATPIAFTADKLNASQLKALGDGAAAVDLVNYLRGDRTKELPSGGFRARTNVLGDIIDSSPTWVGPPNQAYNGPWVDKLAAPKDPAPAEKNYQAFTTTAGSRLNVVYVGSNDGMLHGFRSGTMSGTTLNQAGNDGAEVLAYIPSQVVSTIHSSNLSYDYSSPGYSHNFFVDATPGTGDLYYNGGWHTWLVSGLGWGGHPNGTASSNTDVLPAPAGTLFALDVTDPSQFSQGAPAKTVLGEWSSSTIACVGARDCGKNLGQVTGTPIIRRLHNGNWGVLFGNGLNSATGAAGLFIMEVDSGSGSTSFRYIDTGATGGNGIVNVTSADLDGDHITDFVYAGDAKGNLWRFDLTSKTDSDWKLSSKNRNGSPLFTAPNGLPITTRVTVNAAATANATNKPRVLIAFGTGQKFPASLTHADSYASQQQYLFGIWDWDMADWNASQSDVKYESLDPSTTKGLSVPKTLGTNDLTQQTVTPAASPDPSTPAPYRTVTRAVVCWKGTAACKGDNTQYGWKVPLVSGQEQVIYNPTTAFGLFIVNTTIPAVDSALTCAVKTASGYTMALDPLTGGASPTPFFPDPKANPKDPKSNVFDIPNIGGVASDGTGSPTITSHVDNAATGVANPYLFTQTTSGGGAVFKVNPPGGPGSRITWTQVR